MKPVTVSIERKKRAAIKANKEGKAKFVTAAVLL